MTRARVLVLAVASTAIALPVDAQSVPDGGPGISANYPGDRGIEHDPDVLFREDFEARSIDAIGRRYDTVRHPEVMSLSEDVPPASGGEQSLLVSQRSELGTGADLYRRIQPGRERIYGRFYVKFAEDCRPVHHFGTCLGGNYPPTPWPSVSAGEPPDGDRSFWVGIEPFGDEWRWDYYAYWCEMRGSPPQGQTWGNSFIRDDSLRVRRGRWTCVEMMIKLNDVGDTDGELALWIDGRRVSHLGKGFPKGKWMFDKFYPGEDGPGVRWNQEAGGRETIETSAGGDPFEGFRFRTTDKLDINFLWLYVYITGSPPGHVNRIWFDDVVIAKRYIGPLVEAKE
jgi:hypothetical protein